MRATSIQLKRDQVSHWSTGVYRPGPVGSIYAVIEHNGERPVTLTIHTPGGKAPDGIHGGARRIDVSLTPSEARTLAGILVDAADTAR